MPLADDFDFGPVVTQVSASISAVHEKLLAMTKGQSIRAIALCPDEDVHSVFWMAASAKQFDSSAKTLRSLIKKNNVDFPLEAVDALVLIEPSEWKLSEGNVKTREVFDGDLGLSDAWGMLSSLDRDTCDYDNEFSKLRSRCLEALADGLAAFRATAGLEDGLSLIVVIPDESPDKQIRSLATRLNPGAIAEMLLDAFAFMDKA